MLAFDPTASGAVRDVTRAFPAAIRKNVKEALHIVAAARRQRAETLGGVATYVADLYLLGRGREARPYLARARKRGDLRAAFGKAPRSFERRLLGLPAQAGLPLAHPVLALVPVGARDAARPGQRGEVALRGALGGRGRRCVGAGGRRLGVDAWPARVAWSGFGDERGFVGICPTNPPLVPRASGNAPRPTTSAPPTADSLPSLPWPRTAAGRRRTRALPPGRSDGYGAPAAIRSASSPSATTSPSRSWRPRRVRPRR